MLYDLIKVRSSYFFVLISVLTVLGTYFIKSTFLTESVFFNSFAASVPDDKVHEFYSLTKKFEFVGYLLIPFFIFVRSGFNAICIMIATLLRDDKRYDFDTSFSICLKTEVVFILMLIARIVLLTFKKVTVLDDLSFIPFSLIDFFNTKELPKWSHYAISSVNIWEVFVCYLGWGIFRIVYKTDRRTAFKLFVLPYVCGVFFIICLATFFMVQFY